MVNWYSEMLLRNGNYVVKGGEKGVRSGKKKEDAVLPCKREEYSLFYREAREGFETALGFAKAWEE